MDKKDKQILFELTKDARISIKHLAKRIKLGESSTIYRLKNLFDEKIILDTHAIVDYSKLGYQGYRIYFNFQNTTKIIETEIFNWLVKNKLVSIVGKGDLGADVIIQFWLPSNKEFEVFISELKEKYGQYIKDFEPSIYVKTYFFNRNYLVDEKDRNYFSTGNNKK
jgi:DNA-binding Lrp family transcriptional regulator